MAPKAPSTAPGPKRMRALAGAGIVRENATAPRMGIVHHRMTVLRRFAAAQSNVAILTKFQIRALPASGEGRGRGQWTKSAVAVNAKRPVIADAGRLLQIPYALLSRRSESRRQSALRLPAAGFPRSVTTS